MSNRITFLGFPNHSSEPYVTITTPSGAPVPVGFEATYLSTEEPSDRARISTLDPLKTQWIFDTAGIEVNAAGFAIINHNLRTGSQVRFLGITTSPTAHVYKTAAANGIVFSQNATGSLTNIDDAISSPDGLVYAPTNTADTMSFIFSFPALTPPVSIAAGAMSWVLRVRRRFSGAGSTSPLTAPMCYANLCESGGQLVRSLGSRGVLNTDFGGQILVFPFDPTELTDPTGSNIEVELSFTKGESLSGHQYLELESLALYYEENAYLNDSGWLTLDFGAERPRSNASPTRSSHYFPPDPWEGIIGYACLVRADQAIHDPPASTTGNVPFGVVDQCPDYVDVGVAVAGEEIRLSRGVISDGLAGPMAQQVDARSLGGQSYGADAFRWRQGDTVDLLVTREEARRIQEEIGWKKGRSGAFYVAMEPGVDDQFQTFTAFWATMKNMSVPMKYGRYRTDGEMLMRMSVDLVEKL